MKESPIILEQPLPLKGNLAISDLLHISSVVAYQAVTNDLLLKLEAGAEKYGSPLMTNNGRSADLDQYQDLLDAIAYGTQAIYECKDAPTVLSMIDDVDALYGIALRTRKRLEQAGILETYEPRIQLTDSL